MANGVTLKAGASCKNAGSIAALEPERAEFSDSFEIAKLIDF
jgi:hypothetical protein